jgi:hypothetical protein
MIGLPAQECRGRAIFNLHVLDTVCDTVPFNGVRPAVFPVPCEPTATAVRQLLKRVGRPGEPKLRSLEMIAHVEQIAADYFSWGVYRGHHAPQAAAFLTRRASIFSRR